MNEAGAVTGLFGVIMDLTEFKLAEARSREASALLEATLENMDEGLLMVDAAGTVQVANSRAEQLLGLPNDFLEGKPPFGEIAFQQAQAGISAEANKAAVPFLANASLAGTPPR